MYYSRFCDVRKPLEHVDGGMSTDGIPTRKYSVLGDVHVSTQAQQTRRQNADLRVCYRGFGPACGRLERVDDGMSADGIPT